MILKIKLCNVAGIKNELELNFLASKNDKKNLSSIYINEDNLWINRIAGIIAGNAHGKTTILDALASVGSFIELPLQKKNLPSLNDFEMKEYKDEYKEKIFQKMVSEYTALELLDGNKLNNEKNSKIEFEIYIHTEDDDTNGYYKYLLEYNEKYKIEGIKKEALYYKQKYNKAYNRLFEICDSFESEIGYKIAYEKNYINELISNNINTDEFERKIKYYKTFIKHYNNDSNIICADNYVFPEFYLISKLKDYENMNSLLQFVRLADDNIKEIFIMKDENNDPRLMFKYDGFDLHYSKVSTATQKLVAMAYSMLYSNKYSGVLLIDEFDNSLNLEISKFLIELFSKKENCMSQIIFTTNNPETLETLRRDQIFLILKEKYELKAINFYDFIDPATGRRVRNDFSFIRAYKKNVIDNFPSEVLKNQINSNFIEED